jgi:transketolase
MSSQDLHTRSIHTLRFLSADAVQKANSGHPGLPMGAAAMAYVLWTRHLRFDPKDPSWPARDRFVLSAGHGSMLLYSLAHLTGFDLPMDELKRFRQWGSRTPGHPERDLAAGVETTTGPLGQGFSNAVGLAIAADHLAAVYNGPEFPLFDQRIYAIVSDGDLMEGIASEAASLAGHLSLGRIVFLYDDNHISIDGSTDLAFTEDRAARFRAYGWHVQVVGDGNDLEDIDHALTAAEQDPRPSIIAARTVIGYGLPTKQGTEAAHGEPPGEEELRGAKTHLGWPLEPTFLVPDDVRAHFEAAGGRGGDLHRAWESLMARYRDRFPERAEELDRRLRGDLPDGFEAAIPNFPADPKGKATRASSGVVLNALAQRMPELFGGSADLTTSNQTQLKGGPDFSKDHREGRYVHFGVREHGMGGILSGLALHGGILPFGGTFLVFSDFMRPAIRLASIMRLKVIYVFSHDSIGLGEDGPTHQPIEHLAALRAIPHLTVLRPGDANETAQAWALAVGRPDGPTALALTRQAVPTLDRNRYASAEGVRRGAYILADFGDGPEVILMASGSELEIIVAAGERLAAEGLPLRLVSFPSWELFERQPQAYRDEVLPPSCPNRVAVEAGVQQGWERWIGTGGVFVGLDGFGASAPYKEIYQHRGLTPEHVVEVVHEMMRAKGRT